VLDGAGEAVCVGVRVAAGDPEQALSVRAPVLTRQRSEDRRQCIVTILGFRPGSAQGGDRIDMQVMPAAQPREALGNAFHG
jgi:hypothetical protein